MFIVKFFSQRACERCSVSRIESSNKKDRIQSKSGFRLVNSGKAFDRHCEWHTAFVNVERMNAANAQKDTIYLMTSRVAYKIQGFAWSGKSKQKRNARVVFWGIVQ